MTLNPQRPGGISSNIFTDRFGTLMRVLASSHLVCMSETACGPPPVSYRRFSPEVNLSAPGDRMFHRSSKMDSESNKKRKLDNVGVRGQDVETVKAFDKPRAPLTATAGELKHSSQRLCSCRRSLLALFRVCFRGNQGDA